MLPPTLEALVGWWTGLPPRAGTAIVLAVEGRSGSGKSTLAARLASAVNGAGAGVDGAGVDGAAVNGAGVDGAAVIGMDEIYPGWDGLAAAVPLLVGRVLQPLAAGLPVLVPRWDWAAGRPGAPRRLPTTRLVVLEGTGCGALTCGPYLSGLIWLEAGADLRRGRALARDGDVYSPHWDRWTEQEDRYLAEHDPRSRADLIINTDAVIVPGPHRPVVADGRHAERDGGWNTAVAAPGPARTGGRGRAPHHDQSTNVGGVSEPDHPPPGPDRRPLVVAPVDPQDEQALTAFLRVTSLVFNAPTVPTAEQIAFRQAGLTGQRLTGTFDADRLVATYRSWDWQLSVPGGSVTADAISSVSVLPTHRRRGALTALITADLTAAHRRGVTAAVLVASEATIYGRYGFGAATESATWEVDLGRARIAPHVPRAGSLDLVSAERLREVAPQIFRSARRPGATDRSPRWWDVALGLVTAPDEPVRPRGQVLYRGPAGEPDGYLVYTWQDDWQDRVSRTVVRVLDLQAATGAAYVALWRFLTDLDLVATVTATDRPVDEAMAGLLTDPRAARRTSTADLLWARILDPVAALAGRRYETSGRTVITVLDPLGIAAGTIALQVADDGRATAEHTAEPAELTVPVDVLSSIWLGGGDLPAAALAGRVSEHWAGALHRTARLFRTLRAPWTGTWF